MALQSVLGYSRNPFFGSYSETSEVDDDMRNEIEKIKSLHFAQLPPIPRINKISLNEANTGKRIQFTIDKGTTTFVFMYHGGIVIAVDSRATGKDYIASQTMWKFLPINNFLIGTMAGGASDCQYFIRVLSVRTRLYELRNRERISVAAASKLLANMLYNYKGMGLSIGTFICGYDKKGHSIYHVTDVGLRLKGTAFGCGSGATYAYGVFDSHYRWDMSEEEAYELGRKLILYATYRDIGSGGKVRIVSMTPDGWKIISSEDSLDLYEKFQDEKMS